VEYGLYFRRKKISCGIKDQVRIRESCEKCGLALPTHQKTSENQGEIIMLKNLSLLLFMSLFASSSFAFGDGSGLSAEERWNSFPAEKQARISERAAEMGFDISTQEGRDAFRAARLEKRTAKAAELGFDISTEQGRQDFRQAMRSERQAIREQVRALPEAERIALKDELRGLSRKERKEILASRFGSN